MELLTKKIYEGITVSDILEEVKLAGNYKNLLTVSLKIEELKLVEKAY